MVLSLYVAYISQHHGINDVTVMDFADCLYSV